MKYSHKSPDGLGYFYVVYTYPLNTELLGARGGVASWRYCINIIYSAISKMFYSRFIDELAANL